MANVFFIFFVLPEREIDENNEKSDSFVIWTLFFSRNKLIITKQIEIERSSSSLDKIKCLFAWKITTTTTAATQNINIFIEFTNDNYLVLKMTVVTKVVINTQQKNENYYLIVFHSAIIYIIYMIHILLSKHIVEFFLFVVQ